jgi:CHAT domain-containing protein/Tfp pilus assembly protein PilF
MFFQRWFGHNPQPQSVAPSPKNHGLSDGEYESLFMQLLDGVHQGWSRGKIKGFLVAKGTTEAEFVAWLRGFGKRLLESSEPNQELARCMVQLGEVGCGEVGEIAQDFGNQLLARNGGQDSNLINPNQSQNSSQPAATEARNPEAKVYFDHANQQLMEGNFLEALASYDQALQIKPDYHDAWNNRGVVLKELGLFEDALESYNQALVLQPKNPLAWNNRGEAFFCLGCFEEAITSYDHALQLTNNQYWMAWANRGEVLFKLRGYEVAVQNWNEALQSLKLETPEYQKGCGWLHRHNGDAHYQHGKLQENPFPYWRYAYGSYRQALKFLRTLNLWQQRLEVSQVLIVVCRALGKTKEAQALLEEGTDLLGRLLQETPLDADKIRLSRKFAAFDQLRVDAIAQSGNWCAALELAEQRKNLYLGWLHYGCSELVADSPNYAQMQELLKPSPTGRNASICHSEHSASEAKNHTDASLHSVSLSMTEQHDVSDTAIIYWHISPAAITTFILRYNQPPVVLSGKNDLTPPTPRPYQGMGEKNFLLPLPVGEGWGEGWKGQGERFFYPPSLRQLIDFENWIETWKKDYQNNFQTRWREEMPQRLNQLAEILNIEGILQHLKKVNQLILIPHRDLHLLPLHALFNLPSIEGKGQRVRENFTITYLPSIKVGLDRKKAKQNPHPRQPKISLLSVENPTDDLKFASLESELVSKLYPNPHTLSKSQATLTAIKETLSQGVGVFHFIGHGEHNLDYPEQSALILANKERLTVKDIFNLDLNGCNLVCLIGCETHLTNKFGLIDEFVGLASSFLAVGAMNVIGSLWPIDDRASAYLMTQLHKILIDSEYPDVATALKQAQHLLRNVTHQQLQEWAEQLPVDCSQYRSLRIPTEKINENDKPFESPFYWAAFCAIGL